MKQVLYITNIGKQLQHIQEVVKQDFSSESSVVRIDLCNLKQDTLWDATWEQRLRDADAVLLTHMGSGLDTPFLQKLATWLYKEHSCYALFVDENENDELLRRHITKEQALEIERYRHYSGKENYVQLFHYVAQLLGESVEVLPPKSILWQGILGADHKTYENFQTYMEHEGDPTKPCIGVFFYREEWIMGELLYQEALRKEIIKQGANPIIFFGQYGANPAVGAPSMKESMDILFGKNEMPLEALINTCKFSLVHLHAMTLSQLLSYDIPILQGYNMYMSEQEWDEDRQGLGPMDVNLSVSLPEFDGAIHAGVVAAQTKRETDGVYVYLPVQERIEAVVKRAMKWITLRRTPVHQRKVAIIFHNYPPTNATIGSAAGLDTPESVQRLLQCMKEEGYTLDHLPDSGSALMEEVLAHATNDRSMLSDERIEEAEGKLSREEYQTFFASVPLRAQSELEESWGTAPGEVFRYKDELLIPGFQNGNVWITVQPPRGFGEDPSKLYHDTHLPPPHHYEGFYYWLRHIFQADVVLHIGTHGTLEWLPGKGTGLSPSCYPEMGIQELPNIYPYWTTVVGEGIQAKRRSSACLIGHLTPPMAESGVYEEYEELDHVLDEYAHFERESAENLPSLYETIVELAKKCHFWETIPEIETCTHEEVLSHLHHLLTDMKHMQMRTGLHILGEAPQEEDLREFLLALTRVQNGDSLSLPRVLAAGKGYEWSDLEEHSGDRIEEGVRKGDIVDAIWQCIRALFIFLENREYQYDSAWKELPVVKNLSLSQDACEEVENILQVACERYVASLMATTQEITNTLHAMEGGYIEPGPGGAATSGRADVLPTGRNFYGVDERMLPTKVAYEWGAQLAEQVITSFVQEERRYPESIGIVLWAGSNTRSHGQCLAQFLNLIGVRPIWQGAGGRVVGLEVIPLEELKRPRIDVTARISGLIRDMMPNAMNWLDKAVHMVANLEERDEDNFIKKHVDEDTSWLIEEGESADMAAIKARFRIFGDPPGAYGAGIGELIDSKQWQTIDDIATVYIQWGSSFYSRESKAPPDARLFRRRLAGMEVTIKNEDNREGHMLSSDDYNAYHGGLIAAVRSVRGVTPKSYVGDSSDREQVRIRSLEKEVGRLVRGETLNPKFIQGMKKHGYKGASDLANVVAHSYAWDVTSSVLEDWMYEGYANKYALDKELREWMQDVNPWALSSIAETLLEAIQRGLWNASPEMIEELQELYLSMEGELEDR